MCGSEPVFELDEDSKLRNREGGGLFIVGQSAALLTLQRRLTYAERWVCLSWVKAQLC